MEHVQHGIKESLFMSGYAILFAITLPLDLLTFGWLYRSIERKHVVREALEEAWNQNPDFNSKSFSSATKKEVRQMARLHYRFLLAEAEISEDGGTYPIKPSHSMEKYFQTYECRRFQLVCEHFGALKIKKP